MPHVLCRIERGRKFAISGIPIIVAFCIAITAVLRMPELTTLILSELSRLLQSTAIRYDLELILTFRYHEHLALENLSQRFLTSGELLSVEIDPRHVTLGGRLRCILVAAVVDVSTIIPTWNEEKFLPKCLKSLRAQRGIVSSEIIVVDGGSTDKTAEVAKQYADKVLVKSREPVGAARNAGAREAKGRILAFIDADTMASEQWLDTIARTLDFSPHAVGVTGPTLPYEGTTLDERIYDVATGWFQRLSLRLGLPHVAGFNCAYKKEAFWKAGGFDEARQLSEDIMLSLRIRHEGAILFNPDMLAYTSLRRIKKYGYTYLTTYYLMNWATMLLLNRTLTYPKVR